MDRRQRTAVGASTGTGRPGLPTISYYPPIIVTMLAAVFILLVLAIITFLALSTAVTHLGRLANNEAEGSLFSLSVCGVFGLLGIPATFYFVLAVAKGVRDLSTPVIYTRGSVVDKRIIGGKKAGNWLKVAVRYAGTDRELASTVSEEERSASADRSQILQPRFSPSDVRPSTSSYLPASRIGRGSRAARAEVFEGTGAQIAADVADAVMRENDDGSGAPRVVFRVDPESLRTLEDGEEVLVAHSRYLEHIFYVAHLKDGEWEAFRNKALI